MLNERSDVDILLFPVKPGGLRRFGLALGCALTVACGYRSEQALTAATPLCVRAAPALVPDTAAVEAALDGARDELALHDALGSSYPCLLIELLRVDEVATGLSAPVAGTTQPLARGTAVAVAARGWVEVDAGAPPSRDTGDMRRVARAATTAASADAARHDLQTRAAAERVGRAIALRALGLPEPSDEAP